MISLTLLNGRLSMIIIVFIAGPFQKVIYGFEHNLFSKHNSCGGGWGKNPCIWYPAWGPPTHSPTTVFSAWNKPDQNQIGIEPTWSPSTTPGWGIPETETKSTDSLYPYLDKTTKSPSLPPSIVVRVLNLDTSAMPTQSSSSTSLPPTIPTSATATMGGQNFSSDLSFRLQKNSDNPLDKGKNSVMEKETIRLLRCQEARQQAFPFLVALIEKKPGSKKSIHFCSGAIYNKMYILTAAHCLYDTETRKLRSESHIVVSAGDNNINKLEQTEQKILVQEMILHPRYDRNDFLQHFDIALLRLSHPYRFDENVSSIALPPWNFDSSKVKNGIVAGWEETELNSNNGLPILQYVDVPIIPKRECAQLYKQRVNPIGLEKIAQVSQICTASDAQHKNCRADFGTPLICRDENGTKYVCGVASISSKSDEIPNVYTDTTWFQSWIEGMISRYY